MKPATADQAAREQICNISPDSLNKNVIMIFTHRVSNSIHDHIFYYTMHISWFTLNSPESLDALIADSFTTPCLLFKHSTRCNISEIAKYRLESDWTFDPTILRPYYLDLIAFRAVSNLVAERFSVHHESPQVLLIVGGECIYDADHLDIQVSEIAEHLTGAGHLSGN